MSRATTPSFITELPLKVSSQQNRELEARFNAAMRLYNACLNEAKVRIELVKNSSAYQQGKLLPLFVTRNNKQLANPERKQLFNEARKQYRFSDFGLQAFATLTANRAKWIAEKIDSNTQQKLATRAFNAVEKVLFNKAKKVRFKITTRLRSIEGKSNKQGLRWKSSLVVWGKVKLLPIIPKNNPVIEHGLNSKVKYVRLVWRELNGKKRWFVQLICEGQPYEKPQNYVSSGTIGLDLNISNVAIVADDYAGLLPLADKVPTYQKEISQLQRKMERSRRANNPDKYESNFQKRVGRKIVTKKGQLKKGQQTKWCHSKHYYKTAIKKRELERKKAAYTKSQNRLLVNDILRHGSKIKTENVSVKVWHKIWGKAISNKSPGFFISELHRKAENAGGQSIKFSTQKTALSQTHLTGNRVKKTLSQRVHTDETGVVMHRDLFSAFLARYINEDELSLHDALQEYQRLEPVLQEAWKHYQINCKQVSLSESRSAHSPSEQLSCDLRSSQPDKSVRTKS